MDEEDAQDQPAPKKVLVMFAHDESDDSVLGVNFCGVYDEEHSAELIDLCKRLNDAQDPEEEGIEYFFETKELNTHELPDDIPGLKGGDDEVSDLHD